MSIAPVSFSGITASQPVLKRTTAPLKQSSVAFTGINYGSVVKKCNFSAIFKETRALFSNMLKALQRLKPHTDRADAALGRLFQRLWNTIKPVAH